MSIPTQLQIHAATAAARQYIKSYSEFYSNQISDDLLQAVIIKALVAANNAQPKDQK